MLFVRHTLMIMKKSVPSSAKQQREITTFTFQGHPTMILGEICVRGSQTARRISVLRSQIKQPKISLLEHHVKD